MAAIELAFLLIPLVLMIFGTTELGRAIYSYNTLDKAVRDATRYLSQHGAGDATVAADATCLATNGNLNCTPPTLVPGITAGMVVICDRILCPGTHANQTPPGAGSMNLVSVSIQNYPYASLVQFVIPSMNFNNISVTMRAQL